MATFEGAPWKMTYTAQQLQNAAANQVPFIGSNNNWWRWNISTQKYEDTGIVAHAGTLELLDGSVTEEKLGEDVADMLHDIDDTAHNIYDYLTTDPIYGFIEHNAILAPGSRIEYIGANKDYTPISVTMGGGYSLNSWANFDWLLANKPYMVKSDGTPDYRLDESDYTKREDGTASDVANTGYDGGAYAWAKKIWKKEWMAGDDRHVLFSLTAREGFEPVGFVDPDNNELEGVWLPMFYGSVVDSKMKSIAGTTTDMNKTTDQQKTAITALSGRAVFLGGAILQTLTDLMILFAKTTNLQAAYGQGNSSGYVNDASQNLGMKDNAVVGGGQFYGTSDAKSLNKIFHSIVLGSYQQYMRDPYTLAVNGRFKVSKNYTYDLTGAKYTDTGIDIPAPASSGWAYPHKYQTVEGFGHLPVYPCSGSTSTGGCDGFIVNAGIVAVALRFGGCGYGATDGVRCLIVVYTAGHVSWNVGSASLLLPPAGVGV